MDLSSLDSTLPPALADAERDMGDKFRASALNITNMYKSSLGYMKQAYGVGYKACLADVLSTVQNSMSAGQDPSQALSRLMDWAEARGTAMTALAADDEETTNTPYPSKSRPARPSTTYQPPAPVPGVKEDETRGRPRHIPIPSSTPVSSESSLRPEGTFTPMSSSPVINNTHLARPPLKNRNSTSHSPTKSLHTRGGGESSRAGPSTSSAVPFRIPQSAEFNPPNVAQLPQSESGTTLPTGSKRPLLDVDMESNSMTPAPVTPARGPRSAKRRSMGLGVKEDEERSEKKRGSRRNHGLRHGGHGPGHGHGHGHDQGHGHGGHGGQAV